jgi:hypothetical protein
MAEQRLLLNRSMGRRTRWLRVGLGIGLILLGALAGALTVILLGTFFTLLGLTTRALEERLHRQIARSLESNREQAGIEDPRPGQ